MLHAPVNHMSLLKDPDLHWIRRLAVTPRRGSIVSSRSAWRRAGAPSDGHTQWAAAFISTPQKQTDQESLFMTQWSFCRALFCFVSFFGGGGYTSLISQSNVWRTKWRARALARLAFEMSRLSQPPKWEVRPYGRFFAAAPCQRGGSIRLPTGEWAFSVFCFFPVATRKKKQTKKKRCWILDILCHDLSGWRCQVGCSADTWRIDIAALGLLRGCAIPGKEAKCSNKYRVCIAVTSRQPRPLAPLRVAAI